MRNLFLAAIATLAVAIGSIASAGAASTLPNDSARSQVQAPVPFLFNETG